MQRKTIGRLFIETFQEHAKTIKGDVKYLLQGTLYPDVIESISYKGPSATIKTHHNVGGLPATMNLQVSLCLGVKGLLIYVVHICADRLIHTQNRPCSIIHIPLKNIILIKSVLYHQNTLAAHRAAEGAVQGRGA